MKYYIFNFTYKEGSLLPKPNKDGSHYVKTESDKVPNLTEASKFFYKHYTTSRKMLDYSFQPISEDEYESQKKHDKFSLD